jgi:transposase-like protein
MAIDPKLIDKLLAEHGWRPQDIAGENGLLKQLTKAVLERAMQAELTDHLGYEKHDPVRVQERERAQWQEQKEAEGRLRRDRLRDAAGSERDVRAEDRCQASDTVDGVR